MPGAFRTSLATSFLAGLLAATPAKAEWVLFTETSRSVVYLDPATLHKEGNLRSVSVLTDLKTQGPSGQRSMRTLYEYDCGKKQSRGLSISSHSGPMATGDIIARYDAPDAWSDVLPGTASESILRFVCAR
jgi:hypothetical protein